jgi:miniconductance mechanosensitive channel
LTSFLDVVNNVFKIKRSKNRVAIKGVSQVLKIIIYVILIIVIISFIIGKEPGAILAGLGAASAIILLIFKDTILGFVGGIQLTAYDMVKEGDWISLPQYGADGTVIDISLTTVKVQNWDKTISTIPTYSLVSDSMKNWRGMEESGGRRIKRAVKLDMTSVKFCSDEMLERFNKIDILKDYLKKTTAELEAYNKKMHISGDVLVNGRRQTNLGVFRAYLVAYLKNIPEINDKMTFIVRQLETSEKGIPMEIYVFSRIQSWVEYEAIQSDIFDHILAAIPEFDLRVFQEPTGADFRKL